MMLKTILAMTLATVLAPAMAQVLDLTPTTEDKSCTTTDGRYGECTMYSNCNDNHTLLPDDELEEDDLRIGQCPRESYVWCCAQKDAERVSTSAPDNNHTDTTKRKKEDIESMWRTDCTGEGAGEGAGDACPWCVALYRDGGNPRTRSESGLFCGGVRLDARHVLTAATCVTAARGQRLTARMVGADDRRVFVKRCFRHPLYNSGTRQYDVALLQLEEEVPLSAAACLPRAPPAFDDCRVFGWGPDSRGNYREESSPAQTTLSSVTTSRCLRRGVASGAAICARLLAPDRCRVSVGSPVLCGGQVAGVVSGGGCRPGTDLIPGTAVWAGETGAGDWLHSSRL